MSNKKERICRICLKVADKEIVDQNMKEMFDILLLTLDLNIMKDPLICQDCVKVAKKCLYFKYTCLVTEEIILSYLTVREKMKDNINVIYKEMKHVETFLDEDLYICRICMARLEENNFVSLGDFLNGNMFEMLSEYMPEMDLNEIEDPIICTTCRENFEDYFKFILNCLDIEEKMKAYCSKAETDSMGQVKLENVLNFCLKDISEYSAKCVIKEESNTFKYVENVWPGAHSGLIELKKELAIKKEEISLQKNPFARLSNTRLDKCHDIFNSKEYSPEIKSNMTSSKTRKSITEECTKERKADTKEIKMYKCSLCAYESKEKQNFKRHTLIHKDPSDIEMYKCSLCTYEAKRKYNLKNHMFVHKNTSEMKMYKCSLCAYESKRKDYLNKHMIVHRDTSELKMYKCSLCAHESKCKDYLNKHMIVHRDKSELKMYKCSLCGYEFKLKSCLKTHILIHKDPSDIKMYKCSSCTYECKMKSRLKTHMLVHTDASKIKMHKCSLCAYEYKRKGSLKRHMLIHNDISELKMYKCSECAYEANQKGILTRHMLVHKKIKISEMKARSAIE